MEMYLENKK